MLYAFLSKTTLRTNVVLDLDSHEYIIKKSWIIDFRRSSQQNVGSQNFLERSNTHFNHKTYQSFTDNCNTVLEIHGYKDLGLMWHRIFCSPKEAHPSDVPPRIPPCFRSYYGLVLSEVWPVWPLGIHGSH